MTIWNQLADGAVQRLLDGLICFDLSRNLLWPWSPFRPARELFRVISKTMIKTIRF